MADVIVPEMPLRDIPLVPIAEETKGFAPRDLAPLDAIRVGGPAVFTVDGTPGSVAEDKAIVQYLKEHPDERFWLVHLTASFDPDNSFWFAKAWLRVQLTGAANVHPTAWSLDPIRVERSTELKTTLKLGADLKFLGTGVTPSVEQTGTSTRTQGLVLGMRELNPDPYWVFAPTDGERVAGTYRCSMVVKAPTGSQISGAVSLTANVERKALGVIPYGATPPDPSTLTFALK